MKYVKWLGLLTLAALSSAVLTATASATQLTSPEGTIYTSTFAAESEGEFAQENKSIGLRIECLAAFEGKIESHGTSVTASGKLSKLTFTSCTNGYVYTVLKLGSLEIHTDGSDTSGTSGNGTVTWSGAELTSHTPLGFSCTFTTSGTDIGTLTGSKSTGSTATLDLNSAVISRTGDSALCGTSSVWNGSFRFVTPDTLNVD
ncbi:MAG: hypothetical protein ACTHN3_12690 [Solirubrobacterales bacterium]